MNTKVTAILVLRYYMLQNNKTFKIFIIFGQTPLCLVNCTGIEQKKIDHCTAVYLPWTIKTVETAPLRIL